MPGRRKIEGDPRGSASDRRARKLWLLATFGDGELTTCYLCAVPLLYEDLTVDRIVQGVFEGSYRRDNIRPACSFCNSSTGATLSGVRKQLGLTTGSKVRVESPS